MAEETHAYDLRMAHGFLESISEPFRHAARELGFDSIFLSHARHAATTVGREALVRELQPDSDLLAVDRSLREIRELRSFHIAGESPNFAGLSDIASTLHKLEIAGSSLYAEEGARVLSTLKAMRGLREFFSRRAKEMPVLWKTAVQLFEDRLLEMHFDQVFEADGSIKDTASPELRRIRREILSTGEILRARLGAVLRRLSGEEFVREEIVTQREGRYVIPVKVEHKRRVPGFIHSVSQTGQTVFIEPSETLELNNELRSLEFAEQREIDRILRDLADLVRESIPKLQLSLGSAAHLDAVHAKTRYALDIDASDATLEAHADPTERILELKDARHPLLLEKLGRERTVPLSIQMDHEHRTLVLTGPNAGGKTVLLKTIGLLALMAHAGIPVPASHGARIPKMDGIYVEIGDAQSIADDLSTFSSHVTAIAAILSEVTNESLVLLDELGGGTAPEEGGALAESILEYVTRIHALTIATTHYGRLAAYAEASAGVANGSMEFDRTSLSPTFRFRMGIPGSSHAFDIAERFGLKKSIVTRARVLRGEEGARIEDLVASLSALERDAKDRKREAERELGSARAARILSEQQRDEAESIRRTAKQRASEEAEAILKRANQFIERAVREAKETVTSSAKPADGHETLRSVRARQEQERKKILEHLSAPEPTAPAPRKQEEIMVGATVRLTSNPSQVGTVLSMKGNDVEIAVGSLRMRTKRDQLETVTRAEAIERTPRNEISETTKYLAEAAEPRIDLRGEYGDDAVIKVDRFLADASAHGLDRVEIIHGHGTGALSRRISMHLKGHPIVSTYRFGEPSEGGAGVTIVELK